MDQLALVNWHLGYLKTAASQVQEANRIAADSGHPWGRTFAAFYSAWFHQMRGDARQTLAYATEAAEIAEEKGFRFWMPLVGFMRAWAASRDPAKVEVPRNSGGTETMRDCLDRYRGVGAGAGVTYLSFKLAEDYLAQGDHDAANTALEEGWAALQASGERFSEPEYYRLKARLNLARHKESGLVDSLEEADRLLRRALTTAQKIESKGLELRAAIDRAGMLSERAGHEEAVSLLEGILRRYDETDDSVDCVHARELAKRLKKAGGKG